MGVLGDALIDDILSVSDLLEKVVGGHELNLMPNFVLLRDGVGIGTQDRVHQVRWVFLGLFGSGSSRSVAKDWDMFVFLITSFGKSHGNQGVIG